MKFAVMLGVLGIFTLMGTITMVQAEDTTITQSIDPSTPIINPISMSASTSKLEAIEQAAYERVNQYRESLNLPPLSYDETIAAEARLHSERMASTQEMTHDGFKDRAEKIGKTIPYRGAAENLAYNQGHDNPDEVAVKGWIASPAHHRNMVGKYNLTGIGVAQNSKGEYYFTQLFIKEK
jgi:uncharacterized protein YkwD